MTKLWKPALGLAIVAAIVAWDVGLPGRHSAPPPRAAAHPSMSANASVSASPSIPMPQVASIPGIVQPVGKPEFSATFSGSTLNTSLWATCYPYPAYNFSTGCTNMGNLGTHEDEWYTPSQVQVQNGTLNLIAERVPTAGNAANGAPRTYACRSGMVTSFPGFNFQYGYVQVVANIPAGFGLWPAVWLAASNLQWPPEMDLIEVNNYTAGVTYTAVNFHFSTPTSNDAQINGLITPPNSAHGWHTFALSWSPTHIIWLIDGKVVMTTSQYVPHQKMFIIANLAQMPNVLPGQCNGEMQVRSVAVWAPP